MLYIQIIFLGIPATVLYNYASSVLAVKTGLGYLGICLSNPFAWALAMFYCLFMVCRILRREKQTEA